MNKVNSNNADEYIAGFPTETQILLQEIRSYILNACPLAEEMISYQMPTYRFHGTLVHFAGYKNHIGFYPGPSALRHVSNDISKYKNAKGSIQFPISEKLPKALIIKMVKFRMKENVTKSKK